MDTPKLPSTNAVARTSSVKLDPIQSATLVVLSLAIEVSTKKPAAPCSTVCVPTLAQKAKKLNRSLLAKAILVQFTSVAISNVNWLMVKLLRVRCL